MYISSLDHASKSHDTHVQQIFVRLALANLLNRTIIIDMNVQPIRLVVHRAHAIGLEDAVLLGEIVLRESLSHAQSAPFSSTNSDCIENMQIQLTISSCCSPIFLPMSLLIQSSPEEPLSLDIMPGTTRGILGVRAVVSVRIDR